MRNGSDEHTRLVMELKRDALPKVVINNLYKHTQLEITFSVNALAIDHGKPKTLNLKEIIQCYIEHRREVVLRRTRFDLKKAEERAELLEGYLIALANLDEFIHIIRSSANKEEARVKLLAFEWTREQVERAATEVEELRHKHHGKIVIDAVVPDYHARLPKPCVGGWGRRSLNVTPSAVSAPITYRRCFSGVRHTHRSPSRTARRSLNLLTIEWANRGINLWTIEEGQIPLYPNQVIYALPNDTIDLLDQVTRTNAGTGTPQIDININRISESTYSTIPNKYAQGRPIQVWINRQTAANNTTSSTTVAQPIQSTDTTIYLADVTGLAAAGFVTIGSELISYSNLTQTGTAAGYISYCGRGQQNTVPAQQNSGVSVFVSRPPSINIWPVPNQGSAGNPYYMFVYWRMRRIQDTGTGTRTQDIPFRLIECMVAGLAYRMSMKLPNMDPNRIVALKAEYEQQFQLAADEDREKAPARWVPRGMFYAR